MKLNIEQKTLTNEKYRKILYTDKNQQLVIMSVPPRTEIGMERHNATQFIRVESGHGKAIIGQTTSLIKEGDAIIVPYGTFHNVMNTSSSEDLKVYTIYSPPVH